MWSLINGAADLAAQYPVLAILIAFAAAIIEAVAVLGVLIPGTPILMAVAAAGAMAGMSMIPIMIVAIVGAVIGDFVSYWLGHRFRFRLRDMWPFATRPDADGPRRELLPSLRHGERGDLPLRAGAAVHRAAGRRHGGHGAFKVSACQCEFGVCLGAGACCAGAVRRNVAGGSADRRLAECGIVRRWAGVVHDRGLVSASPPAWRAR